MTQYSLFGDDNFEEPPKKIKKEAAKKTSSLPEIKVAEEVVTPEAEVTNKPAEDENIIPEAVPRPIPLGDIEAAYDVDEKSLEENYAREVFIFEEPAMELSKNEEIEINETDITVENIKEKTKTETQPKSKNTRGRLRLSDTHLAASHIAIPDDETLFSKKYYSIGIVAKMFDVNISLLRYWENEFTILKPRKNGKGDRHFRPEDIKNIQLIHHLLREKKYTLEGAKDFLKKTKKTEDPLAIIENLKDLKYFLLEIKTTL